MEELVPRQDDAAPHATYDGFISYSHAKDKALASALQSAMQRLGKPWYRRRALRLFRDDTSLTATPHLWPSIEKALGDSRFLILIASPEAAASSWVDKEVATWLSRNGPDTVLIALADGELDWDAEIGDFRQSKATPLPSSLRAQFVDEPRWIDLRPYREGASPRDARFIDLAAEFAAAMHGTPKEDLLSQEVRHHRLALRLAGSAVALLVVLLGLAGWQWTVARNERNRAQHNLMLAMQTANGLVFDLAQKFRYAGMPVLVVANILDHARKLQDQLTAGGETSSDLRESQVNALDEVVVTLLARGDPIGALATAKQERDIVRLLLASAPDDTRYQYDLSQSDTKIGQALARQGDLGGALAAYRDQESILKTLAQKHPENASFQLNMQLNLAASKDGIGMMLEAQGDFAGALVAYRDERAIATAMAERDPDNALCQLDLSLTNGHIGDVLQAQGDLAGALAAYRDSLWIQQALVLKDPGNSLLQSSLSVANGRVGDVLQAQGDLAGALAAYRNSLAINQTLAQKDPGNADWQHNLSKSYNRIGAALDKQGNLSESVASLRDSLAILERLVSPAPGWQHDLAIAHVNLGLVLQKAGQKVEARKHLVAGRDIMARLAEQFPDRAIWKRDLAEFNRQIAAPGQD